MDRQKVLAIVGPTGIGKTSLSVWLAKQLDGEIISCDSMQVYKKMDNWHGQSNTRRNARHTS